MEQFETKIKNIGYVENKEPELSADRQDGRRITRKSVGDDKLTSSSIVADGAITTAKLASAAVTQTKFGYELATVTISAGQSSGTATITSGSIILGFYPSSNCDQIVKNVSISGTTLTVNLLTNATATTTIKVVLLK